MGYFVQSYIPNKNLLGMMGQDLIMAALIFDPALSLEAAYVESCMHCPSNCLIESDKLGYHSRGTM